MKNWTLIIGLIIVLLLSSIVPVVNAQNETGSTVITSSGLNMPERQVSADLSESSEQLATANEDTLRVMEAGQSSTTIPGIEWQKILGAALARSFLI